MQVNNRSKVGTHVVLLSLTSCELRKKLCTLSVRLQQDKVQYLRKHVVTAMNNFKRVCRCVYAECAQGKETVALTLRNIS